MKVFLVFAPVFFYVPSMFRVKGSFKLVSFIVFIFFKTITAQAFYCSHILNSEELLQARLSPVNLLNVEILRQNNTMGPQQTGDFKFVKWFELGFVLNDYSSTVGLTENGNLFHVLVYDNKRTFARKLNGARPIKDFQTTNKGTLLAFDGERSFAFSAKVWLIPSAQLAIKKWKQLFSNTALAFIAAKFILWPDQFIYFELFSKQIPFPWIESGFTALSAFTAAFASLSFYDFDNKNPSGLTPVDVDFENPFWFKSEEIKALSHENSHFFERIDLEDFDIKLDPSFTENVNSEGL
jgi:hypothetical protein